MVAHKDARSQSRSIEKTHRRAAKRKFSNIIEVEMIFVARGFIPDGPRSGPSINYRGVSGTPHWVVLGLLRSPSGINPLATGDVERI